MAYFVIGIGGTGAKCIEALTHLVAAGFGTPDKQPIKVMYIDPDQSNGVFTRSKNLIANQMSCQKDFSSVFSSKIQFLTGQDSDSHWQIIDAHKMKLSDLLDAVDNELSHLFFTKQELETELDQGFRGHPSIGAASISINYERNRVNNPWSEFWKAIQADKNSKVFLMGSIFGGTGAAGIPSIARLIDNDNKKNVVAPKNVFIGASLLLPYFGFDEPNEIESIDMHIKSGEFNNAAKEALKFYWTKEHPIHAMYLMGIDNNYRKNMGNFCAGGKNQNNDAHLIELLGALACLDFFNTKLDDDKKWYKTIGYDKEITWDSISNTINSIDPFSFKNKLFTYSIFCYFYQYIYSQIFTDDKKEKSNIYLQTWFNKMEHVFRRKKLTLTDKTHQPRLKKLHSQCSQCLRWLSQINKGNNLDPLLYNFSPNKKRPTNAYNFINLHRSMDNPISDGELHNLLNSYNDFNPENSISDEFVAMLYEATLQFVANYS